MFRLAAAALALTLSAPAFASDWYFITSAADHANISFVDKDSIRQTGSTTRAWMFSLLAKPDDGGAQAYRFDLEVDCQKRTSRLVGAEIFGADRQSQGEIPLQADWAPIDAGTQGETIANFICSRGKVTAETPSVGAALPFEAGQTMLAARARGE